MLTYKTGHVSPAGIAREARVRAEAKARGVEVAPIINREFTPAVEKDFNGEPYLPVAQARRRSGTPQGKDFRSVPNAGGIELAPDGGVEIGSIGNARGIIDTANPGTPLGENPEETIPIVSKVIKTKPSISSDYEELTPEQNKTVEKWIGEEDPDNLLPENYDISNRLLALKEVNLKLSKSSKLNTQR